MIEQGTATDVFDLLDKIRLFALNELGWTVNAFDGTDLYLQSGADYWVLRANASLYSLGLSSEIVGGATIQYQYPGIGCIPCRGYNAGSAWNAQPGAPSTLIVAMGVFSQSDVKEYYFLSDPSANYFHILCRRDTTRWAILILGRASALQKFGTWTGGHYASGHTIAADGSNVYIQLWDDYGRYSSRVQADIDGLGNNSWHVSFYTSPGGINRRLGTFRTSNSGVDLRGRIRESSPSSWNGRAPMLPLMTFLDRSGTSTQYMYAGAVPDVRHMWHDSMANGTEFIVGSDTWLFVENFAFRLIP